MTLSVGLLGPTDVAVDGEAIDGGGPKERALFALLALRRCTSVTAEQLIDHVWPDSGGSRGSLHVHIHNLRRRLGKYADHLSSSAAGYRLAGPGLALDLDRLARLALLVAESDGAGDRTAVVRHAREADALFRGALCEDLPELAVDAERRAYAEQRLALVERRIQAELAEGSSDCLPELEALVVEQPYRERLWGLLMAALYRGQRQADALATYRRAREVLLDEVGVEPGAELKALEQAVLEQRDPLALLSSPPPLTGGGPVLLWLDERGKPRRWPLPVTGEIRIGRKLGADVWLPDDTVSRRHAVIRRTGAGWKIEDLDSLNGTLLNGDPISTPAKLGVGDLVRCGSTMLLVTAPAVVARPPEGDDGGQGRSTQPARRWPAVPAPRSPTVRKAPTP